MRLGIDARFYGIGQRGIGRYVQQLVDQLLENPNFQIPNTKQIQNPKSKIQKIFQHSIFNIQYSFVLFLSPQGMKTVPETPNIQKILAPWSWYSWQEQVYMPGLIKKAKVDLMHFPHFNVPWFCPVPYAVTVHDLILLHTDRSRVTTLGPWLYALKYQVWKNLLRRVLYQAQHIIVPTKAVKDELTQWMPPTTKKTSVIYEGAPEVNPKFKIPNSPATRDLAKRDKQIQNPKFQIQNNFQDPYILYVGSAYPHKNLERLLQAFQLLSYKLPTTRYQLVLVGKQDYFYQRLKKELPPPSPPYQGGDKGEVIFTGEVSDQELAAFYQNASLVVLPSLHEGFGLPLLEAASYSVPIACSDIPVLREIMGWSVFFFNPYDAEDMTRVICEALTNEPARQEKIKKAREHAKQFSWKKMAQETMEIYQNISHSLTSGN